MVELLEPRGFLLDFPRVFLGMIFSFSSLRSSSMDMDLLVRVSQSEKAFFRGFLCREAVTQLFLWMFS